MTITPCAPAPPAIKNGLAPPLYPPPVNPGASYLFLDNASDDPLIILDEQGNLVEFYV